MDYYDGEILTWKRLGASVSGSGRYSMNTLLSETNYSFPWHGHEGFCEWLMVLDGELTHPINDEVMTLQAGDVVLVREQDFHELRAKQVSYHNINFMPEDLLIVAECLGEKTRVARLLKQKQVPRFQLTGSARESLIALSRRLFEAQDINLGHALIKQFLMAMLVEVVVVPADQEADDTMPSWLHDGLQLIDEQIDNGLMVADLPQHFGRTSEHIARSFRQYTGLTPSAYLNQRRLDKAALMLAHSNQPIIDVCYNVGYNHLNYFYQHFKGQYGMTPRQYRMKHARGM